MNFIGFYFEARGEMMFKRLICLVLGVILSISLFGCGENKNSEAKDNKPIASTETPTENTTTQNTDTTTVQENTNTTTTQNTSTPTQTTPTTNNQATTGKKSDTKPTTTSGTTKNTGTQTPTAAQPTTNNSNNTDSKKTNTDDPIMALGKLEFTLNDIEGDSYKSSDIFKDNKLTMINIWGTLCTPCIKELPELQELSEELSSKGISIIGLVGDVSGEENMEDAIAIVKKKKVEFLNLVPDDAIRETLLSKIKGYPVTIFVDSNGNLVGETIVGARSKDEYKSIAEKVFDTLK